LNATGAATGAALAFAVGAAVSSGVVDVSTSEGSDSAERSTGASFFFYFTSEQPET
jgi:hypothetical protein